MEGWRNIVPNRHEHAEFQQENYQKQVPIGVMKNSENWRKIYAVVFTFSIAKLQNKRQEGCSKLIIKT